MGYIACDIAVDDKEPGAEDVVKTLAEIVEERVAHTPLRIVPVLTADQTSDGQGIGVNELTQDVDTQETCCTREKNMTQGTK